MLLGRQAINKQTSKLTCRVGFSKSLCEFEEHKNLKTAFTLNLLHTKLFPVRQYLSNKTTKQKDARGGRNSSVGSAWARCPQRHGFDPPLGTFSGRGDFSLGVNMGSNSIPPKTPSDESINRGLVCAHMHFIARTQKILTFMPATKTHPTRTIHEDGM